MEAEAQLEARAVEADAPIVRRRARLAFFEKIGGDHGSTEEVSDGTVRKVDDAR